MIDAVSALSELIKNAYDADADVVKIEINTQQKIVSPNLHFTSSENGFIKIEDNGLGMSREHVQQHWMTSVVSSKHEYKSEGTTEKKRALLGGQGVGRLSTLWLGNYVELFTTTGSQDQTHAAFDWSQFDRRQSLTTVPLFMEQLSNPDQKKGTTIIIFPIKDVDQWKGDSGQSQVSQLERKVFSFIDRKTFRVTVKLDGQEFVLGERKGESRGEGSAVCIENVWQKVSPALVKEVINFWDENKMLKPGISSEERAQEVVLIIRSEKNKKIVGVSTAAMVTFKQLNSNNFYLYRSIILIGYRHPGLTSKIIVETRDILETFSKQDLSSRCIGMLTFVENPRIQQFRREAIWPASKMAFIGVDKEGRHIRVYYFRGAVI